MGKSHNKVTVGASAAGSPPMKSLVLDWTAVITRRVFTFRIN